MQVLLRRSSLSEWMYSIFATKKVKINVLAVLPRRLWCSAFQKSFKSEKADSFSEMFRQQYVFFLNNTMSQDLAILFLVTVAILLMTTYFFDRRTSREPERLTADC